MVNKAVVMSLSAGMILASPSLDKTVSILNKKGSDLEKNINDLTSLYAAKNTAKYTELNDSNYKKEVLNYKGACIVLFYDSNKTRSPPSARMKNVIDALIEQYNGKIKFCGYDAEDNYKGNAKENARKMKEKYGVTLYPTTVMYMDGKEIDKKRGGPANEKSIKAGIINMGKWWIEINLIKPNNEYTYKYNNTGKLKKISK